MVVFVHKASGGKKTSQSENSSNQGQERASFWTAFVRFVSSLSLVAFGCLAFEPSFSNAGSAIPLATPTTPTPSPTTVTSTPTAGVLPKLDCKTAALGWQPMQNSKTYGVTCPSGYVGVTCHVSYYDNNGMIYHGHAFGIWNQDRSGCSITLDDNGITEGDVRAECCALR